MKTKFFIQAQWKSLWLKQQFMKSDQKCNCNVSNAGLCLDRSAISSHSALRSWTDHHTENVDGKCAAFELVNMRSSKNCLRLDFLDCEDILLCFSGGTDLVFFRLSGCYCTWLTIHDSRHFSLSLQRCWMIAVEAFQIFVTAWLCNKVWLNVCFEMSSNTGLSKGEIRNLLLVCVIEFGCSRRVFVSVFVLGSYSVPFC